MSKIVFVTGLEESGRDTITEMVIKGTKNLVKTKHIKFRGKDFDKLQEATAANLTKRKDVFHKNIERHVSTALKYGQSVVLEGPITIKTADGYLPLIPKEFFDSFSPDVFILFEIPKGGINQTSKNSKIDRVQQDVNRDYVAMYASLAGSPLKIIQVGSGGVKGAIKDCTKVITDFLGK